MSRKPTWLLLAALLSLAGLLAGCSGPAATPANTPPPGPAGQATSAAPASATQPAEGAYPAPAGAEGAYPAPAGANVDPAYPAPSPEAAPPGRAPEPVPSPSQSAGVVHGQLYNSSNDQPIYDGVTVYLSKVVGTENPDMDAVSLDRDNDPRVTPDNEGGFAFADVAPGRYGIVVQGPLNQYLTRRSDDQSKDVIVTVEAGQTVNVGKVYSGYP